MKFISFILDYIMKNYYNLYCLILGSLKDQNIHQQICQAIGHEENCEMKLEQKYDTREDQRWIASVFNDLCSAIFLVFPDVENVVASDEYFTQFTFALSVYDFFSVGQLQ